MSRYRGDLTVEEFYANYNQLVSWYGIQNSTYRLGDDGHWYNSADVSVRTETDGITLYLGNGPAFLDFDLMEKRRHCYRCELSCHIETACFHLHNRLK
ncbi:MAG: hypothetical protein LUG61_09085 [Lachnospiraceae bacterium]|nr:hypothetical protein [Lachnospiraceae bacterium]